MAVILPCPDASPQPTSSGVMGYSVLQYTWAAASRTCHHHQCDGKLCLQHNPS